MPGRIFIPIHFCRDLIDFLILAASFYEKARYYGGLLLDVKLMIPDGAKLFKGVPARNSPNPGSDLFEPPLEFIRATAATQVHVALHPTTTESLQRYIEAIMNDLVRLAGSVLSPSFSASTQLLVDDALNRLRSI